PSPRLRSAVNASRRHHCLHAVHHFSPAAVRVSYSVTVTPIREAAVSIAPARLPMTGPAAVIAARPLNRRHCRPPSLAWGVGAQEPASATPPNRRGAPAPSFRPVGCSASAAPATERSCSLSGVDSPPAPEREILGAAPKSR